MTDKPAIPEQQAMQRIKSFIEAQEELPSDFRRVLYENLWDLYEGTPVHSASMQSGSPTDTASRGPEVDALLNALTCADEWVSTRPHGDNCFVSNHYEGDPGNQCNCGKGMVIDAIIEAYEVVSSGDRSRAALQTASEPNNPPAVPPPAVAAPNAERMREALAEHDFAIGTLKRSEVELGNMLDHKEEFSPEWVEIMEHWQTQIKQALSLNKWGVKQWPAH